MINENQRIVPKTKWKKLKVDTTNIDPDFLEGFIGVEELTDYELTSDGIKLGSGPKEKLPQLKPVIKKRKICYEVPTANNDETQNEEATDEPPKKKKKKKHKSKVIKNSYDKCAKQVEIAEETTTTEESETTAETNAKTENESVAHGWLNCFVPEPVLKAFADLKFQSPTQIQELVLPSAIRDRRDILGAAETGSGKTLAFGIPIINHILNDKESERNQASEEGSVDCPRHFRCLIMTPTRELAIQIKNHLVAAAKYTDITICVVVGGLAPEKQNRLLKKKPDIVIATPGRLWELIQEKEPHLMEVERIKYLVVDEADRMLEAGHFEELTKLLAMINSDETTKATRQTFVFSATLTFVHQLPQRVLNKKKKFKMDATNKLNKLIKMIGIKEKPKIVDITQKSGTCETLTESKIHCSREEKDFYLYYLISKYPGKTIVFCNSIDCVRRLSSLFTYLQVCPLPLHAKMLQKQRLKNLEKFAGKGNQFLIATDVAARGLDIPNIQHVIHYQVPRTSESYIHRSGRTARAAKEGISILLIDSSEQNSYQKICRNLDKGLKELPMFPVDSSILKEVKTRVNLARKLDSMEHCIRKVKTQNSWIESMAKALEKDQDEINNVLSDLGSERKQAKDKREMSALKRHLTELLKKPLVSTNYITRFPLAINKTLEEILKPEKDETAITVARKERKYLEQLKTELKLITNKKKRKRNKKSTKTKNVGK